MKYLCLCYAEEETLDALPPHELDALFVAQVDCDEMLRENGHVVASEALASVRTATTIRVRGGKVSVTDGPFAETKEQLGGFFLIEARDLNDALRIAAQLPSARYGSMEVRPVWDIRRHVRDLQAKQPVEADRLVRDAAMTTADGLLVELAQESEGTRRVLERVPADRLAWKPHERSMSLGQLAQHIAVLPRGIAELLAAPEAEVPDVPLAGATSLRQLLATFDESVEVAAAKLAAWGDEGLRAPWKMVRGTEVLLALPRGQMVRSLLLNHWYHHRGQLTVYLRLLDVPLPPLYGPTADEAFGL